ncbi:MAG TPA: lysophospholipid acyltransferase family protein [Burkholderiaceae bacterium]|nr:lysophospholipid acyltransferase family protein [Burkholderiaceae bacterium]
MRFLLTSLTRVPLGLLYGIGWVVDLIIYHLLRWRRDQVEGDVAKAFPDKPADERAAIVRASYRNLAEIVMETFWGFGASADELRRRVVFENPEVVDRCAAAKQSVVLLTPHLCNWEWLLLAGGATFGLPIDAVYQTVRLRSVDAFLRDARSRFGGRPFPREDFVYELMARAGTPRAYGLIADQTPPPSQRKHWTRMLNRDTAFFVGAESITKFLDATVLYVDMRRVRKGHYAVRFTVLAEPPYEAEVGPDESPIMEAFARQLERAVIERPAQWLWVQKRWKYPKPADE